MNISVVIPTLGDNILFKTLESINKSSIKPIEIIICIPKNVLINYEKFKISDNITILNTTSKGQVAQRAEGFMEAKCEYVLQLDDDIILDKHCIKELIKCISVDAKKSIGPKIFGLDNNYHSPRIKSKKDSFYERFIFFILNHGYKEKTKEGKNTTNNNGRKVLFRILQDWEKKRISNFRGLY